MNKITLPIRKLHEDATVPTYAHEHDAGFDLHACEDIIIEPGETALVKTGIAADILPGYELQIRPRSGITRNTKLRVQLGTIDSGYHGDIGVIVDNISQPEYDAVEYEEEGIVIEQQFDIFVKTVGEDSVRMYDKYRPVGTYIIRKGEKVAQAVLAPVAQANFIEVDEFDGETARGANGFGSSGVK
jgi:dUTP pyrophosphatase